MGQNSPVRYQKTREDCVVKKYFIELLLLGLASFTPCMGQFSGYMSTTYGYHGNPLYNSLSSPDKIAQSYLQLGYQKEYDSSILSVGYVNGLVLFNKFADRNYLEQSFTARYSIVFWKDEEEETSPEKSNNTLDEEKSDETNVTEAANDVQIIAAPQLITPSQSKNIIPFEDSTHTYLDFGGNASARNDKAVHEEFDNLGGEVFAGYRMMLGENYFLRITNSFGYRSYVNVSELSNISDALTFQLGNRTDKILNYGVQLGGGIRHYTQASYDTARFEATRSFVEKASGKGKLGGKIKVPSDKILLTNSGTGTTSQLSFGGFITASWSGSSLGWYTVVRINSNTPPRYIAQVSTNSTSSEDIYNDHFSYSGLESTVSYKQNLPLGVAASIVLALQKKTFNAPAYDLSGNEIEPKRKDLRGGIEIGFSRPFDIGNGFALEVSVEGGVLRNKSNDNYSDFSTLSAGVGIGIGF